MLTSKFVEAFDFAFFLHQSQTRKGTSVPYIAHLMSVAALVLENGGDEELAIAGLLHDAVEDQGGRETLNKIRIKFGERVAKVVDGCTDSYTLPKPPWRKRKEEYLAKLDSQDAETHLVSLSDKVHNTRSLLMDLQKYGPSVWERFNGGKSGTLWYYRALADYFADDQHIQLASELNRVVSELERIAQEA